MKRAATFALTPVIRAVEWLFGARAPGIDLTLLLFAAGWCALMVFRPEIFDRAPFVGLTWLPDDAWIGLFGLLTALHLFGLLRPGALKIRTFSCLCSAWVWISVSGSIAIVEITTGVVTYGIIGCAALAGSLYLSGQPGPPRKAG